MMNTDNLTAAQRKAIDAGGTKNAVIGGSLVKRGIFEKNDAADAPFPYRLTAEYMTFENAKPVPAVQVIGREQRAETDEIRSLRDEFPGASEDRQEEIRIRLAQLGTVVYPAGTPEYDAYRENLRKALADPNAFVGIVNADEVKTDAETILSTMETGSAPAPGFAFYEEDDAKAIEEIGSGDVPAAPVEVRDPNAMRYADIEMWTDERLDMMEERVERRLKGKLFARERSQSYSHLARIKAEIERRAGK